MAISDIQKIDWLWKKVGYGVAKTDVNSIKSAVNESISSGLLLRSDQLWADSGSVPNIKPLTAAAPVALYTAECTQDATATPNRTWKTGYENWIPPQFGATYQVNVYIDSAGAASPASTGTKIFAAGSGNNDEWFFDYQSGVLNFIGDNLPSGLTGNVVYIEGAVYEGGLGLSASGGTQFGSVIVGAGTGGTEIVSLPYENLKIGAGTGGTTTIGDDDIVIDDSGNTQIGGGGGTTTIGENVEVDPNGNLKLSAIAINGNRIETYDSNANLELLAAGTGIIDILSDVVAPSLTVSDLTSGRVLLAGTDGELEDSANLTFDGTTLVVTGDTEITGNLTLGGNITIGDADTDSITVAADFESHLIPNDDGTYDLGSDAKRWRSLYVSGSTIYLGGLKMQDNGSGGLVIISEDGSRTDFEASVIDAHSIVVDEIELDGNRIRTLNTNADLELDAAGTGRILAKGIDLNMPEGNIIYVTVNGNDTNSGSLPNDAYATIKHALSQANSGDTIRISAGTFTETFPLDVPENVSVVGEGLRATQIKPSAATRDLDCFRVDGGVVIESMTIREMEYNSTNDTGYAIRYKPTASVSIRSAYIKDITVANFGSSVRLSTNASDDPYGFDAGDAGRGALVDGASISPGSIEPAMLFDSVTFIVPNSVGLIMTNGARVEWLNCFTYFAHEAIKGITGTTGRGGVGKTHITLGGVVGTIAAGDVATFTSTDGSTVVTMTVDAVENGTTLLQNGRNDDLEGFDFTPDSIVFNGGATATSILRYDRKEFAAEMRSIASANVYGNFGIVADGPDTSLRMVSHNFGYIGVGKRLDNDDTAVVQANEITETNGGRVYYSTVDQRGDFRIGAHFTVDQQTGNTTFQGGTFDVTTLTGINFVSGVNTSTVDPFKIETGNLRLAGNSISTITGDINLTPSGTSNINLSADTEVSGTVTVGQTLTVTGDTNLAGNLDVTGNVNIGGNITIGDADTDAITVAADFESNLIPDEADKYDLGSTTKPWNKLYASLVNIGQLNVEDVQINGNRIETVNTNSPLELDAAGTGTIELQTDTNITGDATVSGTLEITGVTTINDALDVVGLASLDGGIDVDGAFTVADTTGNINTTGTLDVTGDTTLQVLNAQETTLSSVTVSDLTAGRIVLAGTSGAIEDSGNLTFDGTTLDVTGNLDVSGDVTIGGNITIGDADTDGITVAADFESHLIPNANETYDLGSATKNWRKLYVAGQIHLGGIQLKEESGGFKVVDAAGNEVNITAGEVYADRLVGEDILITGNRIATTSTNSPVEIIAAGTGTVELLSDTNITGAVTVSDTLDVTGDTTLQVLDAQETTLSSATISDLTANRIVLAGTSGAIEDSAALTFDGTDMIIGTTSSLQIPVGTTLERPTPVTGQMRFNSTDTAFEGYDGTAWASLGGVKDVDQDTKIIAESSPGTDNDELDFYTAGSVRMQIGATGDLGFGPNLTEFTIAQATGDTAIGGTLGVTGTSTLTNVDITGTLSITGNASIDNIDIDGSTISASTDITIDPNPSGAGGTLTVAGLIDVTGNATLQGTLDVDNEATLASAIVEDLTDNRIVIAGSGGAIEDDANLTFDGTEFSIGAGNFTVQQASGDTLVSGDLHVDGTTTLAGLNLESLTNGRVLLMGASEIEDNANLTFDGTTLTATAVVVDNITIDGNTISTSSGTLVIDPTPAGSAGTLTIQGDLQVMGTTTTINSTVTTLDDPILTLGGDTAPATDDTKDKGVEFRWHTGTDAKVGFFGFDRTDEKFTFISDATNSSEVFAGTLGNVKFGNIDAVDINATGNVVIGGNITIGDSDSDGITIAGEFDSDLIPNDDVTYDLGTDLKRWKDLYLSGNSIYLGNVTMSQHIDGMMVHMPDSDVMMDLYAAEINAGSLILDDIRIDGNLIQTTESNSNLQLGVSGTGEIELKANTTIEGTFNVTGTTILSDVDTAAITATTIETTQTVTVGSNINVDGDIITPSITITDNTIATSNTNSALELKAAGTGAVEVIGRFNIENTTEVDAILDEDDLVSDSATAIPTQQSVKAYVDSEVSLVSGSQIGNQITLGAPSDGGFADGAYKELSASGNIAEALDQLNETMFNVANDTFVRGVTFSASPQAGGEGTTVTLSLTVDGNSNRYDIDWGDGNTTSATSDNTPSHTYTSNAGSPYTVVVRAFNNSGSGYGSEASATNTDYIVIYTADPVMAFSLYNASTGGSALTGNEKYVIEGDSLYLENLTTNTSMADVTYSMNWGDGSSNDSIASDAAAGGVAGSRLQHTWAGGTATGTGSDTLTLQLLTHTTATPALFPMSTTTTLKVYDPNIAAPQGLSTKTISLAIPSGSSPKLAAGATDNSNGSSTLTAGDDVQRNTATTGFIESSIIPTFAYNASAGTLHAKVNGANDGTITLSSGDDTAHIGALDLTEESDYNLLNASGSSTSFGSSIYHPALYSGFKARVKKATNSTSVGINTFQLSHTATGDTNLVEFVKDTMTDTPIVTEGTIAEKTAGTYRYISGVPYYNTGSPVITLSGVTIDDWIGQTYMDTPSPFTVESGTNLEGTSQSAITSPQSYSYALIDGATTFLTGGIPNANTGNGTPYSIGPVDINITSSSVRTVEQLRTRGLNVNGYGDYQAQSEKIAVHTAAQTGISEIAISVSNSLGSTHTDDAVRIFDFNAATTDNPAYVNSTNFYTNNPYTESTDPGVEGTQEATIRLGVLEHNVENYSSYLPVGPDRSGDTGTQYFTMAFRRSAVSKFRINISSSGIAGMWLALPGSDTDTTSGLNGWLDCSTPYGGNGKPGSGTGGNTSDGVADGPANIIGTGTSLSGNYQMTLGTVSTTSTTGNVVLIRIALTAGQSVSSLSILEGV